MAQEEADHLSRISTLWTLVAHAKGGPAEAVSAAQQELVRRYHRAVYRYLLGALPDADAADELGKKRCSDESQGIFAVDCDDGDVAWSRLLWGQAQR
jgi:hypothetical protein